MALAPAVTFDELVSRQSSRKILLVEITPKEVIEVWSKTSGLTNTYQVRWDHIFIPVVGKQPQYRLLVDVYQNDVRLLAAANLTDLDANSGKWFHDEVEQLVYVHTTTGSDPDLFTSIVFHERFFFATSPLLTQANYQLVTNEGDDIITNDEVFEVSLEFADVVYNPRVGLDDGLSTIRELEDFIFGPEIKVSQGELRLINGDGWWDSALSLLTWKNARVTLLFGGDNLPQDEYKFIHTSFVEDFSSDRSHATFFLRDVQKLTQQTIPKTLYWSSNYNDLDSVYEGVIAEQIVYGKPLNCPGVRIDIPANQLGRWKFSSHALFAIDTVYDADGATIGSEFLTKNLTDAIVDVLDTYTGDVTTLSADLQGLPHGSATRPFMYVGEILRNIYVTHLGARFEDWDLSASDDFDSEEQYELAIFLNTRQSAADLISSIARFSLSILRSVATGELTLEHWTPTKTPTHTLQNFDLSEVEVDFKVKNVYDKVVVKYNRDNTTNSWLSVDEEDNLIEYVNQQTETLTLETHLKTALDATRLAQRMLLLLGSLRTNLTFTERGISLMNAEVGNFIRVSSDRAPSEIGSWDEHSVVIKQIRKSFNPFDVEVTIEDLPGVIGVVGVYTADSAVEFSSASVEERRNAGYYTNDSGFIVPGDSTTEDGSIYW